MKLIPLVLLALTSPAFAAKSVGFAVKDLTELKVETIKLPNGSFVPNAAPKRLTWGCEDCKEIEVVDILLNKSTDGTEGRFRSGKTTIQSMEKLCQSREPTCTMERVDLNGATGWVSRTQMGLSALSTTILFKRGDVLVIRSIANTPQAAYENGKMVREKIAPQIIGR